MSLTSNTEFNSMNGLYSTTNKCGILGWLLVMAMNQDSSYHNIRFMKILKLKILEFYSNPNPNPNREMCEPRGWVAALLRNSTSSIPSDVSLNLNLLNFTRRYNPHNLKRCLMIRVQKTMK